MSVGACFVVLQPMSVPECRRAGYTNHFNPFMLYFDPASEGWKIIALLPILPNFSYRISF